MNSNIIDEVKHDRIQMILKLDSDIPFLSLLKRTEIACQLTKVRIDIVKVGTGFIEGGSACNVSRLFTNTKHNQITLTT